MTDQDGAPALLDRAGVERVQLLGLSTVEEVSVIVQRVFPEEPLSSRSRLLLEEVIDEAVGRR